VEEWLYDPGIVRSIATLPGGGFLMSGTGIGDEGDIAVRCVAADGGTPPLGIGAATEPGPLPSVLPNPAAGCVSVTMPGGAGTIRVYDLTGRLAAEVTATDGTAVLDVSGLPEGVYAAVVTGGNAVRFTVVR